MNRNSTIQILGISFAVFFVSFFITKASAMMPAATIGFNINESIQDASYLQWKIETTDHYSVSMWLEDGDGETIEIRFSPNDEYDPGDYKVGEKDDYLRIYFSSDTITYESEFFEDLISLFISEDDDSTFDLTDDPEITRIRINCGTDLKLYSITLADNEDFNDPCWEKEASNWNNLNDFILDGGEASYSNIRFYNSYIQVTNSALDSLHNSSGNSLWSFGGNIGWNQPNYGWNQPYNYGWNQPNYGWSQPYNYGWNQPNYGWNQPFYGWNQPYNYEWNQPISYGWNFPYNYGWNQFNNGWNQPYNPYNQSVIIHDDGDIDYPINFSRVIWTDPFQGYDPFTGSRFII